MPKVPFHDPRLLQGLTQRSAFMLTGALIALPAAACSVAAIVLGGERTEAIVFTACALAGAAALYLLAALHTRVRASTASLVALTERIAAGDLVSSRESTSDGQEAAAAEMRRAILKMSDRLTDIVRQVRGSADHIAAAARDIAEGNSNLAHRTQEQAASLEQTAAGIEELAATAQQNAADCSRATQLAATARDVAQKAAGQMQELAGTMAQIDDRARQVADILGTVEGIAFQTNILALNAAVEAARAGETGRGFAVVATEVRALAQRSAAAAKEIKALIGDSSSSVEQGGKLVHSAELTIRNVVESARQVSDVIAGIASATAEQSAGIEAINEAVVQIDTANQQNAAMVEEASAAAASFEGEAARLLEVVGRFKVDRGADRARVVALVKEAAAHLRKVGKRQACADFNDRDGKFGQGEWYVFALDANSGARLSYAPDPSVLGQNSFELRDADGRYYCRDIIETGRTLGFGWCDFKMLNPRTGRVEPKSVYTELVDGIALGCGIYKSTEEQSRAAPSVRSHQVQRPARPLPRLAAGGSR